MTEASQIITHIAPLDSEGSRRRRDRHQPLRQQALGLGGRGAEAQFLQLGHLYRRDDARRLQGGERHRRQYEPVRDQRRAVRQAARRQSGLRRHRSGQRVRRAHDPGRICSSRSITPRSRTSRTSRRSSSPTRPSIQAANSACPIPGSSSASAIASRRSRRRPTAGRCCSIPTPTRAASPSCRTRASCSATASNISATR